MNNFDKHNNNLPVVLRFILKKKTLFYPFSVHKRFVVLILFLGVVRSSALAAARSRSSSIVVRGGMTSSSPILRSSTRSSLSRRSKPMTKTTTTTTTTALFGADKVQSSVMISTTTTTTTHDAQLLLLLQDWIHHSDSSYHHFSKTEAAEIRQALLTWYRANRRKLPWRGDPPPYDGSTAGINNNNNNNNNKSKKSKDAKPSKQANITTFFQKQPTPQKSSSTTTSSTSTSSSSSADDFEGIPVSGYGVWVSEIMLQQTRVEAVIPYWIKWMQSFPTVQDLAAASEEQVNAHWAGLGFYRRARLLHQGAKHVVENLHGEMPRSVDGLLQITGIGPYTANAIASIAFDVCVPVVDGNVCRVLSRLTGIANHIKAPILKDKLGWDLTAQLVNAGGDGQYAGEFNQALMELGATYCAPSGTGVDPRDPLVDYYKSTKLGRAYFCQTQPPKNLLSTLPTSSHPSSSSSSSSCKLCDSNGIEAVLDQLQTNIPPNRTISPETAAKLAHAAFPLDPPKSKKREEDLAVAAISNSFDNKGETWWLLVKRPPKGLLAGQWEFPSVCVQTRDNHNKTTNTEPPKGPTRRKALSNYLQEISAGQAEWLHGTKRTMVKPAPIEHVFSHIKHIMWVESCNTSFVKIETTEWKTSDGKEVRWMRETDMVKVGITSGVKKILKAVKAAAAAAADTEKSSSSPRKRKR